MIEEQTTFCLTASKEGDKYGVCVGLRELSFLSDGALKVTCISPAHQEAGHSYVSDLFVLLLARRMELFFSWM